MQDKQMNYFSKNSYIQNTWMLDSISVYKTIVGVKSKELLPNMKLLLFITLNNTSYSFACPVENKLVVVKYS